MAAPLVRAAAAAELLALNDNMGALISIIIPVKNEAARLPQLFANLHKLALQQVEIIAVDGSSTDNSLLILHKHCDQVLSCQPQRAKQMQLGALHAKGDILLFLHADCLLSSAAPMALLQAASQYKWGRFNAKFDADTCGLRVLAFTMNWRSRLTQVATGDQAMWFRRDFFNNIGGFAKLELMEDIEISKRARQHAKMAALSAFVLISARRFASRGLIKTILLMWCLRLLYAIGIAPATLHKLYYRQAS